MLDFDLTIKKFYESVEKFLEKRAAKPYDKGELQIIKANIAKIKKIASDPKKYANYNARIRDDVEVDADAFIKHGSRDNSVYTAFNGVLWILEDFYKNPNNEYYQNQLLARIKAWKLSQANNMLKSFYYSVVPNTYFAAKVDLDKKSR